MLQKRSIALPLGVSLVRVADASRHAVNAFLVIEPSIDGLGRWLRGPYEVATRYAPRRMINQAAPESNAIAALIAGAQQAARAMARAASSARGTEELVRKLPPVVHILPAHDGSGAHGFIPIDAQGGRLADRVVALVLADYLTRPRDFAEKVATLGPRTNPDAPTQPKMQAVRVK